MRECKKKQQRPASGPLPRHRGQTALDTRCPLLQKRSGALKGKVGGVMQGQRQVNVTPNDSAAIGFNPLANFHH